MLEHPAYSRAFSTFDLPRPGLNVWQRGVCGGWAIELDQAAFGHIARKRTWLYTFGATPPLPPAPGEDTGRRVRVYRKRNADGSWSRMDDGRTTEITHAAAEHTPPAFARWLVNLAQRCAVKAEATA